MRNTQANLGKVISLSQFQGDLSPASPAAMARHLRRTNPARAHKFAIAMQEAAAWANEAWGQFWADVARLV